MTDWLGIYFVVMLVGVILLACFLIYIILRHWP